MDEFLLTEAQRLKRQKRAEVIRARRDNLGAVMDSGAGYIFLRDLLKELGINRPCEANAASAAMHGMALGLAREMAAARPEALQRMLAEIFIPDGGLK